jgi:hypothetical protein
MSLSPEASVSTSCHVETPALADAPSFLERCDGRAGAAPRVIAGMRRRATANGSAMRRPRRVVWAAAVAMALAARDGAAQPIALDLWVGAGQWRASPAAEIGCGPDGRQRHIAFGAGVHRALWRRIGTALSLHAQSPLTESGDACLTLPVQRRVGDTTWTSSVLSADQGTPRGILAVRGTIDLVRRRSEHTAVGLRLLAGPGIALGRGTLRLGAGAEWWVGRARTQFRLGIDGWQGETRLEESRRVTGGPTTAVRRATATETIWTVRAGIRLGR